MRKRRHHERANTPKSPMPPKSVQIEGDTIPEVLRGAIDMAGKGTALCRITHKKTKVALISAKWIPLIMRLESASFSRAELTALDYSVFDEDHTPKKRSQEIVAWAKNLGKNKKEEA